QRRGHRGRRPRPDLRPVLHHAAERRRHPGARRRPRPRGHLRHRSGARRPHPGRQRARRRLDLHRAPAVAARRHAVRPSRERPVSSVPPSGLRVLVVDDEESMRWFLRQGLARLGWSVEVAADAESAVRALAGRRFDAAVVDVRLPGADGLTVLREVRARDPDTVVVMITAYGSIPAAVGAIKRGAFDYISKPFGVKELADVLERGLQARRASAQTHPPMVAESPAMRAVLAQIEQVKDAPVSVLIRGESGVGKELVARALHARSPRAAGPFVAINCAALPDALVA